MPQSRKALFFALFFLSGFSGLIYQSIWSHYLKLFLGHAAYAQTLVLAIFMGGMALGSLASGFFLHRWRRLLIGYAVVEAIIGILAVVFHSVFTTVTDLTFSQLISGLGHTPIAVVAIKWGVASLLIFPQSVLLGMTFPLMVGGILRHFPERPGYTLSMLYFTNSFGAVFGVLASSFVFIGWVGLPGTMLTAGLLNLVLALLVWSLCKNYIDPKEVIEPKVVENTKTSTQPAVLPGILLFIAFMTGLSSFMYEIGWIRMLVLVLGGSTHSFELMLASFILGIALGGLWIRNRIDTFENSRVFLGYVQVAMALAAVLSLWLYHFSFDWMAFLMDSFVRKESTYGVHLIFSGLIAMAIMLPATFCAGMTLPLITRLILKTSKREKGVGYVYSANTLGAIIGIFLSVHVILPMLGLKSLIVLGAVTDIGLGLYLLGFIPSKLPTLPKRRYAFSTISLFLFTVAALLVQLDVNRLSSGVYRAGNTVAVTETIYHSDGKTSTVTVGDARDSGLRVIKNNGKTDASINMNPDEPRSGDESTQILISAYPLFQKPDAKEAAIIGMGSGMSTHTLLTSSIIESVDTIEMEAKVLEGAKLFQPMNSKAYDDPRSHLHVEDAKTFFSSHGKEYDIIISEPPNPWVSGVSTLFSQEFYSRIKRHLKADGLFAQWIHLYEIDMDLVGTVFNALDAEFEDYVVYRTSEADIVILASPNGALKPLDKKAFEMEELTALLDTIHTKSFEDLQNNRIGSKRTLSPMFSQYTHQTNSDYFPILDHGAPKARYARASARPLAALTVSSIPVLSLLENRTVYDTSAYTHDPRNKQLKEKANLLKIRDMLTSSANGEASENDVVLNNVAALIQYHFSNCGESPDKAIDILIEYADRAVVSLSKAEQAPFWDYIEASECVSRANADSMLTNWVKLYRAILDNDASTLSNVSTELLDTDKYTDSKTRLSYLMSAGLIGDVLAGDAKHAEQRWDKWKENFDKETMFLPLVLLLSNIGIQI